MLEWTVLRIINLILLLVFDIQQLRCIYACMCVCVYVCIYIYMYVCVRVCVCVCVYHSSITKYSQRNTHLSLQQSGYAVLIDKPELSANISFLLSCSGYTSIEGRQRVSAYCSHSGFQAGRGAHFQILLVPSLDCKKDLILAIKWSGPEVTHFVYHIGQNQSCGSTACKRSGNAVFHVSGRQKELDIGKEH